MAAAESFDVLIVGGGPVGSSIAHSLAGSPLKVGLIEPAATTGNDPRPIALSHGSRLILERIGCWPQSVTAIAAIHVSQQGRFGRTLITREEHALPALGYVAAYGELRRMLSAALTCTRIEAQALSIEERGELASVRTPSGEFDARLVVLAEGGQLLESRSDDYGQLALVAQVSADTPHNGHAWERFTPEGPLALLPFGAGYAMVWSVSPASGKTLSECDEPAFVDALQRAFGHRAGHFTAVAPRAAFPLALRRVRNELPRSIAVGNAAQTLHPVAGQGLNLGLRDGVELAELILNAAPETLGSSQFIAQYRAARSLDRGAGIRLTDLLVKLFSNSNPVAGAARGAGLCLLDLAPGPRRFLARRMMFGARALP